MDFFKYSKKLNDSLLKTSEDVLSQIFDVFKYIIHNQGTVILCGNGGSFANSLHIAGDYHKTFASHNASFHAVGENFCSISAIANDNCFEEAMSITLSPLIKKEVPTCVVFLSGSGNSLNLIKCANKAKNLNIKQFSISGFNS